MHYAVSAQNDVVPGDGKGALSVSRRLGWGLGPALPFTIGCGPLDTSALSHRRFLGVVAPHAHRVGTVATILVVKRRCTIARCTHPTNSPWNPRKASLQAQDLPS